LSINKTHIIIFVKIRSAIFILVFMCDAAHEGGEEMLIEYRGEVLLGYVPGLPTNMSKVRRKAGPFLISEIKK